LVGWNLGFAFLPTSVIDEQRLRITDETGDEVGTITLSAKVTTPDAKNPMLKQDGPMVFSPERGWTVIFLSLGETDIIIKKPGVYYLSLVTAEELHVIGQIHFVVIDPPPLTQERIAAIRSEPDAAKHVRLELGCKKCPSKFRTYASLERTNKLEEEGWRWYELIPDEFICDCKSTRIDLSILRRNLHGLLGRRRRDTAELNFVPLYEKNSLESIRTDFVNLLNSKPNEEILQKFLYENSILLHQFPSEKLFPKSQILTFFVTDLAIVTPQKELILIELEKTTTRLMKKDGGVAAQLNHAFDQVRGWLQVVDEHRLAVLDSLKIEREMVSKVSGVVIAGRDIGYDAQHLRRLKGTDWGRITLLTYDDLLFSFDVLIRGIDVL